MLVGLSTNKDLVAVNRNIVMSFATTMKVYADTQHPNIELHNMQYIAN